jgi:hypothetical protein
MFIRTFSCLRKLRRIFRVVRSSLTYDSSALLTLDPRSSCSTLRILRALLRTCFLKASSIAALNWGPTLGAWQIPLILLVKHDFHFIVWGIKLLLNFFGYPGRPEPDRRKLRFRAAGRLELRSARRAGRLELRSARRAGRLELRSARRAGRLELRSARGTGRLELRSARGTGRLELRSPRRAGRLELRSPRRAVGWAAGSCPCRFATRALRSPQK